MTTTAEDIVRILTNLDKADDTLWTDDGSPRMDVLIRLANDKALTRRQVNEALPGFNRNPAVPVEPEQEPAVGAAPKEAEQTALGAQGDSGTALHTDADAEDAALIADAEDLDPLDTPIAQETVKEIMTRRMEQATADVADAQAAIRRANENLVAAQRRESRLKTEFHRRFPPLSPAQNMKLHLATQHALAEARAVASGSGLSVLDAERQTRRRAGRTYMGPTAVAS